LIAFILQFFIIKFFGISESLDIYIASNTINLIIVGIATGSLNYAITPIFIKYYKNKQFKAFRNLANSLLNIIFIIFFILAIVQYLFSSQITSTIFPVYINEENILLSELFSIQAFISILTILTGVLNAINYALNNLYRTIVIPIITSVFQIVFIYFSYEDLGIFSLVYALAINQLLLLISLGAPYIKHYQFSVKKSRVLKNVYSKTYPLIISSFFAKSDVLVDRYFASTLITGSISTLYYGQLLIDSLVTIINKGVSLVSLRNFSIIESEKKTFNDYFLNLYEVALVIAMFFAIHIIVSTDFILEYILSEAYSTSSEEISRIYMVTISLIGFFIGGLVSSVLVNAFYAKGFTALISKMTIILQTIGIVFKIIFFKLYGFYALPIIMSLKSIIGTGILIVLYNKNIYRISYRVFLIFFIKVLLFTCTIVIAALYLKSLEVSIFVIMLLSSIVYVAYFFKFIKEKLLYYRPRRR
jgi:putative peptidoglycan lipid II flippase